MLLTWDCLVLPGQAVRTDSRVGHVAIHCGERRQRRRRPSDLYWVDHQTGDATYLGLFSSSGASGPDGFSGGACGNTLRGTTPTTPETFYCGASDNETPAKAIIISCTLTTTNQPGNQTVSCSNITPGTKGIDLV